MHWCQPRIRGACHDGPDVKSAAPRLDALFGIDLRTLALFRVALAGVISVDLLRRLCLDLVAFHSGWGVLPGGYLLETDSLWRLNLLLVNEQPWFAALCLSVALTAALSMLVGYRTRAAVIVLFVLVAAIQNRNPMILIGGDLLICCLLFWSLFLPLGARWSVDAALSTVLPPPANLHRSWASAGVLVQVMSVYFFSAVLKNGADWWPSGLAVYYTIELERYATPFGRWLLADRQGLMQALSYFVYFLEWLGPLIVFLPWASRVNRFIVMLLLMGMHVGFILCIEIGHFPYVSLSSLTLFLGGWFWDALDRRAVRDSPLQLFYDRDCGFCLKMCLLLRTFLVLPRGLVLKPAQDDARAGPLLEAHYSWVVIDANDQAHLKWEAFVALLRASALFGWLAPVAAWRLWRGPGTWAYDLVGRARGPLGAVSGWLLPLRPVRFEVGKRVQEVAGLFLLLVLVWNAATIERVPSQPVYATLTPVFRLLRIDQLWNMFAPYPSRADGWTVFPGRLEDGSEVDVLRPGQPLKWDKPARPSQHENIRWHTYRWRIWEKRYAGHRLHYGRYLCRQWNADAAEGQRLLSFRMVWMQEFTVPPGQVPTVKPATGWSHQCVDREKADRQTPPPLPPSF